MRILSCSVTVLDSAFHKVFGDTSCCKHKGLSNLNIGGRPSVRLILVVARARDSEAAKTVFNALIVWGGLFYYPGLGKLVNIKVLCNIQ